MNVQDLELDNKSDYRLGCMECGEDKYFLVLREHKLSIACICTKCGWAKELPLKPKSLQ